MHQRHFAYKSLLNTEGNLGFKRAELSLDKQVLFSFQLGSIRFNFVNVVIGYMYITL